MTTDMTSILDASPLTTKPSPEEIAASRDYVVAEVKSKIAELSAALLAASPTMPLLLREIHTQVRKDPELITIISEEEIGIIVNGLKVHTNTELLSTAVKAASKKTKVTIDDI